MHSGQTDNYELTQFGSSDKPAWLTDYNGDMRKIDAQMKANADAIAQNAEDITHEGDEITSLKERMTTAEADIDTAQEDIGTATLETLAQNLKAAVNELLGMINAEGGDIHDLEQAVVGMGDSITAVNQLAYTIANVYDSASTYAVGAYAIYQNTLYKCTTAITVGEAFDPAKWTSVKVMNEMPHGGGGSVVAQDVSYDNTTSGLSATNVQGAIDGFASVNGASQIGFNDSEAHFQANNVEDAIKHLDTEGHNIAGELQTTTLTAGSTSATVNFTQSIIGTTIITPVCNLYGVNPTAVTYTTNSITLTFEAQAEDAIVGARIQTI